MLFNSYSFIFLFLPAVLIGYFFLNRKKMVTGAKVWLAVASLFFYAYWNVKYLPLLIGSIVFNYTAGSAMGRYRPKGKTRRMILYCGITGNLLLLVYYKYADFFISNADLLFSGSLGLLRVALPLGISFFTFTQIAYLVDSYRGDASEYDFVNYILFVTFFPHLIAGPIIHHKEMMPQFDRLRNKVINWKNVYLGLFLFTVGLFKKVVIADGLSLLSVAGFDKAVQLNFGEAWVTSLSYTLQLYFDFSGYTDMALGLSLMFNIVLPVNFNSPYKALDIADFWRRWHITLSRFLKDYVYIPLGGSRTAETATYRNLLITFVICGFWHGAGWNFILWGLMNGLAICLHRIWRKKGRVMPRWLAWVITFNFINLGWVFFRAKDWTDASKVLRGMAGLDVGNLSRVLSDKAIILRNLTVNFEAGNQLKYDIVLLISSLLLALISRNSNELMKRVSPDWKITLLMAVLAVYSTLLLSKPSQFLYFRF